MNWRPDGPPDPLWQPQLAPETGVAAGEGAAAPSPRPAMFKTARQHALIVQAQQSRSRQTPARPEAIAYQAGPAPMPGQVMPLPALPAGLSPTARSSSGHYGWPDNLIPLEPPIEPQSGPAVTRTVTLTPLQDPYTPQQPTPEPRRRSRRVLAVLGACIVCYAVGTWSNQALIQPDLEAANRPVGTWSAPSLLQAVKPAPPSKSYKTGPPTSPYDFKIASYNILTKNAASEFKRVPKSSARAKKVADFIISNQLDAIMLQEVSNDQFAELKKDIPGYKMFPEAHRDEQAAGSRAIIYNSRKFKIINGGSIQIPKLCEKSSMAWAQIQNIQDPSIRMYLFSVHLSPNGPVTKGKACTKNVRPGGSGPDNEDGPSARTKATTILLAEIPKNVNDNSVVFVGGDMNSTLDIRKSKDGKLKKSELPPRRFMQAGYIESGQAAETKVNAKYSTSHHSVHARITGDDPIDHILAKGNNITILKWTNVVDSTTEGTSDHTPIIVEGHVGAQ